MTSQESPPPSFGAAPRLTNVPIESIGTSRGKQTPRSGERDSGLPKR
jgi:hypothetical protein